MHVAQSHGLAFRENATLPGTSLPALAFEAPGCSRPGAGHFARELRRRGARAICPEQGDALRYVYIDHTWEKPDRLAFFVERMKYAALATFGLTRYVPSGHLLLVDSPSPCAAANTIDWGMSGTGTATILEPRQNKNARRRHLSAPSVCSAFYAAAACFFRVSKSLLPHNTPPTARRTNRPWPITGAGMAT
jgi:hypothetical protein